MSDSRRCVRGGAASYTGASFIDEMHSMDSCSYPGAVHSRKVFLSGIPRCVTAEDLHEFFSRFGAVEFTWPQAENDNKIKQEGHAFAVFLSPDSVMGLVENCVPLNGHLSVNVPVRGNHPATINVRVWSNEDANFYCAANFPNSPSMFISNAVFVDGIPPTVTAKELHNFMSLKYGDVIMAQIEVEPETYYPRGAGYVVFRDREAFVAAIASGGTTLKFEEHVIQVALKPYLVRIAQCDVCQTMQTRCFCPQLRCLKYMCESCWHQAHADLPGHYPKIRTSSPHNYRAPSSTSFRGKQKSSCHKAVLPSRQLTPNYSKFADGARNLFSAVNSIPVPSISLFESERFPNNNQVCRNSKKLRSNTSDGNMRHCNQRTQSNRPSSRIAPNTPSSNLFSQWDSCARYNNNNNLHKSIDRGDYANTTLSNGHYCVAYSCQSSPVRSTNVDYSAGRISNFPNNSCPRPVIASNVSKFARVRTSFSPTVRRPARHQAIPQTQRSTSTINKATENVDTVIFPLSQFKLF